MRLRIFVLLLLVLFYPFIYLEASSFKSHPSHLVSSQGAPCTSVENCVNVLSGEYFETHLDVGMKTSHPFNFLRHYTSARPENPWIYDGKSYLFVHKDKGRITAISFHDALGAELLFNQGSPEQGFKIDSKFLNGTSNCFSGLLSGQFNLKNMRILPFNSSNTLVLEYGDGSQKIFEGEFSIPGKQGTKKLLTKEIKSTFVCLHYYYDVQQKLTCMELRSKDSSYCWATIKVSYDDVEGRRFFIEASDGQRCSVECLSKEQSPHHFLINKVRYHNQGKTLELNYSYKSHPSFLSPKLCRKDYGSGRCLEIDYYTPGPNIVKGKTIQAGNFQVGKVKFLKGSKGGSLQPEIIQEFIYEEGVTTVIDACGNETKYYYDTHWQVVKIEYFDLRSSGLVLVRQEFFTWSDPLGNSPGCLIEKKTLDGKGSLWELLILTYDERGNVIKEQVKAVIEGILNMEIADAYGQMKVFHDQKIGDLDDLDDLVTPVHFSCERSYVYEVGARNRMIQRIDEMGNSTFFEYEPNSTLLKASFECCEDQIRFRKFYFYDNNGMLCRCIQDDGVSRDFDDLQDVNLRLEKKIVTQEGGYGSGLPSVLEDGYINLDTREYCLLKRSEMIYDSSHRLIEKKLYDSLGRHCATSRFGYDSCGNVTFEMNPLGHCSYSDYDSFGNKVFHRGVCPKCNSRYSYDCANNLIRSEFNLDSGEKIVQQKAYNVLGHCVQEVDRYGNSLHYTYDRFGKKNSVSLPSLLNEEGNLEKIQVLKKNDLHGLESISVDPKGGCSLFFYTTLQKPYFIRYPDLTCEKMRYNKRGDLLHKIGRSGIVEKNEYDFCGRITKKMLFSHNCSDAGTSVRYHYKGVFLTSERDHQGVVTFYSYDFAGRLIEEFKKGADQKVIARSCYRYDSLGRRCELRSYFSDKESDVLVTKISYDLLDRKTKEEQFNGNGELVKGVSYSYNAHGHVEIMKTYNERESKSVYYDYDCSGNLIYQEDELGQKTYYRYEYHHKDEAGRQIKKMITLQPSGVSLHQWYNVQGRVAREEIHSPSGNCLKKTYIYYDVSGNKISEKYFSSMKEDDHKSFSNRFEYNLGNKMTSFVEGSGSSCEKTTRYAYSREGLLQTIYRPDGKRSYMEYNYLGKMTYFEIKEFKKNPTDNLWGSFVFQSPDIRYRYSYEPNTHQLDCIANENTKTYTSRKYNFQGMMIEETLENGLKILFDYDFFGRKTKVTYPDNSYVTYTYDAFYLRKIDRYNALGVWQYRHEYFDYNLNGKCTREKGIHAQYELKKSWNQKGELTQITTPYYSCSVDRRDALGNIIAVTQKDLSGTYSSEYTYDDLSQLIEEKGAFNTSYEFDSFHNVKKIDSCSYSTNELNQIFSTQEDGLLKYDTNGNLLVKKDRLGEMHFVYDCLGRLLEVEQADTRVIFSYDPFDRCMSRHEYQFDDKTKIWRSCGKKNFIYDDRNELGSALESGKIAELRVLGCGAIAETGSTVCVEIGGSAYGVVHDFRGNIIQLLNSRSGKVEENYRYSAFGKVAIASPYYPYSLKKSRLKNCWLFCGKRSDESFELINYGRRFYVPDLCRWLTPDPLGYEGGLNLYAFVSNNPLIRFDAYGLFDFRERVEDFFSSIGKMFSSLFDSIVGGFQSCCSGIKNFARKTKEFFSENFVKVPHSIIESISNVSSKIAGFIYQPQRANELFFVHDDKEVKKKDLEDLSQEIKKPLIIYQTGMMNTREDAFASTSALSKKTGQCVGCIFIPSRGFFLDLSYAFIEMLGVNTNAVEDTKDALGKSVAISQENSKYYNGNVFYIPHSRGCIEAAGALPSLEKTYSQNIKVFPIGAPNLVKVEEMSCLNIYNIRDGVPLLATLQILKDLLFDRGEHVRWNKDVVGVPLIHHRAEDYFDFLIDNEVLK